MVLAILFLLIAILSVFGGIVSVKRKNFFAAGFSGVAVIVFGFFQLQHCTRLFFKAPAYLSNKNVQNRSPFPSYSVMGF